MPRFDDHIVLCSPLLFSTTLAMEQEEKQSLVPISPPFLLSVSFHSGFLFPKEEGDLLVMCFVGSESYFAEGQMLVTR